MSNFKTDAPIAPPRTLVGIIRRAGPGMIVAGSIVGSGELVATTKTGAEAGFVLMWLILIGCVVKVFAQVEFGKYAIVSGRTTLAAMDEVPGPRLPGSGNWLVCYWFVMWLASIAQLGGIVGGVGQALAISIPVTEQGRMYNAYTDAVITEQVERVAAGESEVASALEEAIEGEAIEGEAIEGEAIEGEAIEGERSESATAALRARYIDRYGADAEQPRGIAAPSDDRIWAGIMAVATAILLAVGRYGLIQSFSTVLVGSFTALTIVNLFLLQRQPAWQVRWDEFVSGLSFGLPSGSEGGAAVGTALATFGIIGVGAAELVTYPYWCLEKGYARFTGPRERSEAWMKRARGWLRVLQFDAWGSMVVYTFSTLAFYLLGAAVLYRAGLDPGEDESEMIRRLAAMFEPVFSSWAAGLFLFGSFAVLYSTYFVANASHARVFSDGLRVMGWIATDERTRGRWIRGLSGFFPLLCFAIYLLIPRPVLLVMISGFTQGLMLPMLGGAALYLRYRRCPPELRPGRLWDACLWLSGLAMLVTGGWTVWSQLAKLL